MTVREAVEKRRSTRYYQDDKKISDADINLILRAGQKAPNGLALEAWKFFVLSGDFTKISDATYGQPHIQKASHVIALVNYKQELVDEKPELITDHLVAKGLTSQQAARYIEMLDQRGTQYYREQLMFAASQMVLQATELGIGSVIVGGFDRKALGEVIGLDQDKYEVGLLIDFGYPEPGEVKERIIRKEEDVIEYIKL